MTLRSTDIRLRDDERGVFIIILGGIIVSMFIILSLAIDSGGLYNGQLATQAAADAAVSAGAALLVEQGLSTADVPGIKAAMVQMAHANLALKLIPPDAILPMQPDIDTSAGTVHIKISTNIRLWILRLLPGMAQLGRVNAVARARVRPAVVSLILDTSYSMCCRTGGAPCNPSASCPIAGSKLEDLQIAVSAFVDLFDPIRDNINLVVYALGAEVLVPFRPLGGGFPMNEIKVQIANLIPGGATNPSDAFMRAYLDAASVGLHSRVAYLNFSDGAPTAARFFWDKDVLDPVVRAMHENNVLGFSWSTYDFLSWAVFSGNPGSYQSIPYFFVRTPSTEWDPRLHRDAYPPPQANVIRRGPQALGESVETFSNLASSVKLRLPDGSSTGVGGAWESGTWDWYTFRYREEYFNYALKIADFARTQGGAWYAIGLGDAAPMTLTPTGSIDPYQNADQDFDRKDIFLTRLANDSCGLIRADPKFPGFADYNQLAADGRHEGLYLSTPASEELRSMFGTIARRIKMQLIE